MNAIRLSTVLVTALLSTAVFAQSAQTGDKTGGKTRAEVHQELLKAQHEGAVPVSKLDYPPKAETVKRNKELHEIAKHPGENDPAFDHHDKAKSAAR
jgi:hypothetical protein